jgi:hypothetical protein
VTPNLPGEERFNYPVRLRITAHQLNVEGQSKDQEDWTSIPIDAVVKGRPVTVTVNRRYLLNALRFGLNELEVEDSLSPVVFSKVGKRLVIMPLRPDDSPVKAATPAQPNSGATPATQAATPPAEQTTPQEQPGAATEERIDMPRQAARTTTPEAMTTFQPVETHANNNGNGNGNGSAVKSLVDHVEQIKENLKNVIRDLTTVIDAVKAAEKEKRTSDKEIDAIRTKLRQIQNVTI